MLKRRSDRNNHAIAGVIGRNPREAVGLIASTAAILMIFFNALFMQPGPHPAPIFGSQPTPVSIVAPAPAPVLLPARAPTEAHAKAAVKSTPVEAALADPIAQLLGPSKQVLAVQRVLTAFGFGQIRPTGLLGPETQDAIKKFERSRKMPVTGTITDRLVQALAELSGQSLD